MALESENGMRISVNAGRSSFSDVEWIGHNGGVEAPPGEPPPIPRCKRRVSIKTPHSQLLLRKESYHTSRRALHGPAESTRRKNSALHREDKHEEKRREP